MAIARKPKTQSSPESAVNVDALINKGGSVARPLGEENQPTPTEEGQGTTSFTLRVPNEILTPLDTHRKKQSYKVPRQQWILEAIMQRLEREGAIPATPES